MKYLVIFLIVFGMNATYAVNTANDNQNCDLNTNFVIINGDVDSICQTPYEITIHTTPEENKKGIITIDVPQEFLEPGRGSCVRDFPSNVVALGGNDLDSLHEIPFEADIAQNQENLTVEFDTNIHVIQLIAAYVIAQPQIRDSCLNEPLNHIQEVSKNVLGHGTFENMVDQSGKIGWIPWLTGLLHMKAVIHPTCDECGYEKNIIHIPEWYFRGPALWWTEEKIPDDEFISGIEYLMKNNIIQFES